MCSRAVEPTGMNQSEPKMGFRGAGWADDSPSEQVDDLVGRPGTDWKQAQPKGFRQDSTSWLQGGTGCGISGV